MVASLLRAGQVEVLAQRVKECGARVELQTARFAIHFERDVEALLGSVRTWLLRFCTWDYSDHGCSSASDQDPSP